jgi:ADP-ribose pyrophosphatase YjhB (NUDIX family)
VSDQPVHANHRRQAQYPRRVKFCPLCGSSMEPRVVASDHVRRKVCTQCGFVHFPGPKLVAGCLVIDASRVLLLRRGIEPALGKWTFPGGYVDFGESAADAAVRETREEVKIRVTLGPVLGVLTDAANPSLTLVVYLAEPDDQVPGTSEEATESRYFGVDEIPWHELAFPTTFEALTAWVATVRAT